MKAPDYIGLSDESKMIVQKENRLFSLASSNLSLDEFKILDAFLSRIDSHKPEKNHVRFERGDLEQILNKKRISFNKLQENIKGLFNDIKIIDESKPDGFVCISLFKKTQAYRDEDGIWQVDLVCTDSAAEYFFNVEKFGYIKYMLTNISNLSSRTSYILYLMLEGERNKAVNYRKGNILTFTKRIDDLKAYLNCDDKACYKEFKYFNAKVLKKCHSEINEKTTLKYDYKPVNRRGVHYQEIEFTIHDIRPLNSLRSVSVSSDSSENTQKSAVTMNDADFTAAIFRNLIEYDLTIKQVASLNQLLKTVSGLNEENADEYLQKVVIRYNERAAAQEIESPYAYMSAMIKGEINDEQTKKSFADMTPEERIKDLERRLKLMKGETK